MKKRSLGIFVSVVAALVCGLFATHRAGTPPARGTALVPRARSNPQTGAGPAPAVAKNGEANQEVATLEKKVDSLSRELAAIQRRLREQERAERVATAGRENTPANNPRNDPVSRATVERERQEAIAVLEADFHREPTDRTWSSEATAAVQEALAGDETAQTALRSLECRSQTCRMELADDTGELAKGLPVLLQHLAPTLPSVTANQIDDGAGGTTTILYLARE